MKVYLDVSFSRQGALRYYKPSRCIHRGGGGGIVDVTVQLWLA